MAKAAKKKVADVTVPAKAKGQRGKKICPFCKESIAARCKECPDCKKVLPSKEKATKPAEAGGTGGAVETLEAAQHLVELCGGVDGAMQVLNVLKKLGR